ncbi:Na+/H+ antiporter NhaC [Lysinibacillus sp. fkY74-1]|uniref:Sodium:proton antiporter n=2 Tax=Lysinibacillus TaxID=400634 RepID=W7S6U1_LYSSH|nr:MULTISPECIES: Na+/H+ antiporter NhaC [Lysinibacillus]MBE5082360.1 Na+/H+ antiporter NhaC [Bacillus thuringiensis]AMO33978.1 Na+/H+ antiporter NhaC [Lysinibacillus sphaericus]AMR90913.1 Na+/H+ antiporter NhaC [Lysinibacillus sphaericus]ANA44963.1 Na+/H+ antiporter NhaC [Lysinibacillus sphaericus]EWH33976.1 sodium:proton antiporter [Lysinibacillus sphaericus CBAM5]
MFRIEAKSNPRFIEASFVILLIIATMAFSIGYLKATPHIPIFLVISLLLAYGLLKRVSFRDLEGGMIAGASAGLGAVFIFFFIGILISSWIMGGTIPTLIYYGFLTVSPNFFFAIVFLICSIVGISVGSSLTTVATVGVAFMGIAGAMDISLTITAGAIVSGAFFGDKMSPLSDTTNLASGTVGVDLFEHIKNMGWTTIPAFLISFVLYAILSPTGEATSFDTVEQFKEGLLSTGLIHWYTLLPIVVLVIMTFYKAPAVITLAVVSILGVGLSYTLDPLPASDVFKILFDGYVSHSGNKDVDALLTRGGMNSMLFTIALVLLALTMGGLLFTLGIIQSILAKVESLLKSAGSVITGAAITGIGINTLIGEQYLSILLTGEAFKAQFAKVGLAPKNLSRVMEDAGTVVNPLVPWSVCGIFITSVLGISTLDYLPFTFFCLLGPILTVIFGWSGKTLTKLEQ